MKPTEKQTPNNNPILAALLFFVIMALVVWCFAAVSDYIRTSGNNEREESTEIESGLGDSEGGTGVFGSGTGEGAGGKAGDNIGEGTEKEQGAAKQETPAPTTKTDQSTGPEQGDAGKQSEGGTEGKAQTEVPVWEAPPPDAKIADLQQDDSAPQDEGETEETSGSSSFTSGGKSVFKVKKHENVLFIIDMSPSMNACTAEGLSRVEVLKIQLKATLDSQLKSRSRGRYGIIAFSGHREYFPGDEGMKQCRFDSRKDHEKAQKWITDLRTGSATHLAPALRLAGDLVKNKGIRVDTVYLLTDGEPYDGFQGSAPYIDLLRQGLPKKVKVHTISIGTSSQLLKDIANAFNGKYEEYR